MVKWNINGNFVLLKCLILEHLTLVLWVALPKRNLVKKREMNWYACLYMSLAQSIYCQSVNTTFPSSDFHFPIKRSGFINWMLCNNSLCFQIAPQRLIWCVKGPGTTYSYTSTIIKKTNQLHCVIDGLIICLDRVGRKWRCLSSPNSKLQDKTKNDYPANNDSRS